MKKKIVLVEDDKDLLFILKTFLNKAGYEVDDFVTGSPIVNNECDVPDLFIFDVKMQIIDGCALCKFLKLNNRTKEVPIMVISGYHDYRKKVLDIGANQFLPKPLNIEDFLQAVATLTERQNVLSP